LSLQTDEEWEEDELGKAEQGVSVSQLLGESGYKGELFPCSIFDMFVFY
jgi:hypothetical protein